MKNDPGGCTDYRPPVGRVNNRKTHPRRPSVGRSVSQVNFRMIDAGGFTCGPPVAVGFMRE
jgi:hypothetical protein